MAEQPMNPLAGVAGPGPFSTRTDQLNFQSDYYGQGIENKMLREAQPLAKTPDVRGATATEVRQAATREPITELYAPSQRKDEPVTSGIAQGPGLDQKFLVLDNRQNRFHPSLPQWFNTIPMEKLLLYTSRP